VLKCVEGVGEVLRVGRERLLEAIETRCLAGVELQQGRTVEDDLHRIELIDVTGLELWNRPLAASATLAGEDAWNCHQNEQTKSSTPHWVSRLKRKKGLGPA